MIQRRTSDSDDFRNYLDERFARMRGEIASLKELMEQRAAAGEQALTVAKAGLNEMRNMALDAQSMYQTKVEYQAQYAALEARVNRLSEAEPRSEGFGRGLGLAWQVAIAVATLAMAYFVARRG